MEHFFLRKSQRLISNGQFRHVLSFRCWFQNGLGRMYVLPNSCGYPRIGLSVSKKCGNSVCRNRIKRFMREVFRLNQHEIRQEFDYLLILSHKMSKKNNRDSAQKLGELTSDQIKKLFIELAVKVTSKADRRGLELTNDGR